MGKKKENRRCQTSFALLVTRRLLSGVDKLPQVVFMAYVKLRKEDLEEIALNRERWQEMASSNEESTNQISEFKKSKETQTTETNTKKMN